MHFKYKITDRLKVKEWEKYYMRTVKYEKAFVAILTPNIIDLKTKNIITRNKFGHFKMGKNQFTPKTKQSEMHTHLITVSK